MLDVQALYLKQLAAEENHVKGLAKIPGSEAIDLEENKKEVEKVLQELQYWERSRPRDYNIIVKAMAFRFLVVDFKMYIATT